MVKVMAAISASKLAEEELEREALESVDHARSRVGASRLAIHAREVAGRRG